MDTHKVITVNGKVEVFRGTYQSCEEYAMTHVHTWGYMDIIPI
jgi:hypothetical protein